MSFLTSVYLTVFICFVGLRGTVSRPLSVDVTTLVNDHVINTTKPDALTGFIRGLTTEITNVTLRLNFEGEELYLDVNKQKSLISDDFRVKLITSSGEVYIEKEQLMQNDCFYRGNVRGYHGGPVSLSTCNGVRGEITHRGKVYSISPEKAEHCLSCRHEIYEDNTELFMPHYLGSDEIEIEDSSPREMSYESLDSDEEKVIEMFAILTPWSYENHGQNVPGIVQRLLSIFNFANQKFEPVEMSLRLVGMEIWADKDRIDGPKNASTISDYVNAHISYPADQYVLFGKRQGVMLGQAYVGLTCNRKYSGLLSNMHRTQDGVSATILSHELGHRLGLRHSDSCECAKPPCIMAGTARADNQFEGCGVKKILQAERNFGCFKRIESKPANFCGNGVLDKGEDCDCGTSDRSVCDPKCCQNCKNSFTEKCLVSTALRFCERFEGKRITKVTYNSSSWY